MKHYLIIGSIISCIIGCIIGCAAPVNPSFDIPVSSCITQVRKQDNGWILNQAETHFVFWGAYWQTTREQATIQGNWNYLYSQKHVFQRLAEYGIEQGMLDPTPSLTNPGLQLPGDGGMIVPLDSTGIDAGVLIELDDGAIGTQLDQEIRDGIVPPPQNDQTLYVIFLPPNSTTVYMTKGHFAGYHGHASYGSKRYAFAIIGYSNDIILSHEMYEAFSDPDDTTGYRDGDNEIGDLCENIETPSDFSTTIDGVTVQKVWSQSTCTCL